jgi:carboxyl-terminal processing protease
MYFKFANYYIENNPGLKIAVPGDELFIQFKSYLNDKSFSYESQIEKKLKEIEKLASEKSYTLDITSMLDKVELEAENGEQKEIDFAKDEILKSIADEINMKIITDTEQIEAIFPFDIQLLKAVEIIENKAEYNRLLGK